MGAPEAEVENHFIERAKILGILVRKMQWISREGAPDRFFAYHGFIGLIEFKSPDGKLRPSQKREIDRLRNHGVPVYVISTIGESLVALTEISKAKPA